MRTTRSLGVLLAALALGACGEGAERGKGGEGGGSEQRSGMLPAVALADTVPTGDWAGPRDRSAERVRNPYAGNRVAVEEGHRLYREMNCADCHGYEGQGGMGPSLTDGEWLFGDTPVDRFISIRGGRARGMPAYGNLLPDETIWQIVAYIEEGLGQGAGQPRRAGGQEQETRSSQDPQGGRH